MVSKITYRAVWDGLLEVARAVHYFQALERRYHLPALGLRFTLALAGCSSVASLLFRDPMMVSVSGAVVTALVILDLLWNLPQRVTQLRVVNNQLTRLEQDYRNLWRAVRGGSTDDPDAVREMNRLNAQLVQVSLLVDMPGNPKLGQKTQERAFQVEELRYGA